MKLNKKVRVIACATVIEEMLEFMPTQYDHMILDFGLHIKPEALREALQEAVDESQQYDTIILGYGLCSQAVIGLKAGHSTLVIPKVHDCIAIFLGSGEEYQKQSSQEPGTYYFTKGWIEVGDSPFHEFPLLVEKYGQEKAERMMKLVLANYTRLCFINTGLKDLQKYQEHTKKTARKFDLRYEEIKGKNTLIKKMLFGPWDEEFVIINPGKTSSYNQFF